MAQAPPILIYQPGGGVSSPIGSNPPVYSQAGTTALVEGQDYLDIVFGSTQTSDEWVLVGCIVVNETDVDPLNIWPGIITDRTEAGFRIYFNGMPDSGNYYLHWSVSGINIEPSVATTYFLTGPSTGDGDEAATFTVSLPPGTYVNSPVTVTPAEGGLEIGVFSPETVTLTTDSPSATFIFTPALYGDTTITVNNDRDLTDPADLDFTVATPTYTFTGPSSGTSGVASSDFTVELVGSAIGTVTVTPSDGGDGGTFTPTTVALTTVAPSDTFTYTPASGGDKTISVTNDVGLVDPDDLIYTSVAPFDPTDIAGLTLWLEADSLALADGTAVGTWADSSGNGYDFTQATAGFKPIFKTAIVNGKPVLRFDGSDDRLVNATAPLIGDDAPYTIFAVISADSAAINACIIGTGAGGVGGSVALVQYTGAWYHQHFALGSNVYAFETGGVTAGTFCQLTGDSNGTNMHLWRGGVLKDTTGVIFLDNTGTSSSIGLDVPNGNLYPWDGDIAEILLYNSSLSVSDRQDVEDYLATKYGL